MHVDCVSTAAIALRGRNERELDVIQNHWSSLHKCMLTMIVSLSLDGFVWFVRSANRIEHKKLRDCGVKRILCFYVKLRRTFRGIYL